MKLADLRHLPVATQAIEVRKLAKTDRAEARRLAEALGLPEGVWKNLRKDKVGGAIVAEQKHAANAGGIGKGKTVGARHELERRASAAEEAIREVVTGYAAAVKKAASAVAGLEGRVAPAFMSISGEAYVGVKSLARGIAYAATGDRDAVRIIAGDLMKRAADVMAVAGYTSGHVGFDGSRPSGLQNMRGTFGEKPPVVILEELDKMHPEAMSALARLLAPGFVPRNREGQVIDAKKADASSYRLNLPSGEIAPFAGAALVCLSSDGSAATAFQKAVNAEIGKLTHAKGDHAVRQAFGIALVPQKADLAAIANDQLTRVIAVLESVIADTHGVEVEVWFETTRPSAKGGQRVGLVDRLVNAFADEETGKLLPEAGRAVSRMLANSAMPAIAAGLKPTPGRWQLRLRPGVTDAELRRMFEESVVPNCFELVASK